MIREQEAHAAREIGLAPGKCLQPGAEHDVLADAARRRCGQPVFGKPAADRHHGAEQRRVQRAMIVGRGQDRLLRCLRHEADRDRVVEDHRRIEQLMRRAPDRGPQDRPAGSGGPHDAGSDRSIPYWVARPICRITGFHNSCSPRM
jgi:hypothetical protein